ncbi:unnamed protein product [Phyllotreta striolata]|uniref:Adenylyltransferase and sulfurtransferase MOCS3 homolog n=1 Tax=Phyllotreta striolata TaxID=444603 RepID=A0A9N9TJQ8_PHYSR|nr:unnamed protein product [Phyllotreta striolata]
MDRNLQKSEVDELKQDIQKLKDELRRKERLLFELQQKPLENCPYNNIFKRDEIVRYSRQMIMSEMGTDGQEALKNSNVLIVGIGGLGCPAALYLASSGVGKLTLVDYDTVELSNIHRQILHSEENIDIPKVDSAYAKLKRLNHNIKIVPLRQLINNTTVERLMKSTKYDVVLDCTDNVATRYLLNDACVLNNIPLVSGSALQMEGQLTVYHYMDGPCYRCLFPVPPPPETVTNCGDGGVLGPIPGVIGTLQALEAIKIIIKSEGILTSRFLIFDGASSTFRNVKLRKRNKDCEVCGDSPTILTLINYEQFCRSSAHDKVVDINIVKPEQQVDVEYFEKCKGTSLVIDVRPELEFKMCSLPSTINYPFTKLTKNVGGFTEFLKNQAKTTENVFFICRRGNDSQRALNYIQNDVIDSNLNVYNVKGGLRDYALKIDSNFPIY